MYPLAYQGRFLSLTDEEELARIKADTIIKQNMISAGLEAVPYLVKVMNDFGSRKVWLDMDIDSPRGRISMRVTLKRSWL